MIFNTVQALFSNEIMSFIQHVLVYSHFAFTAIAHAILHIVNCLIRVSAITSSRQSSSPEFSLIWCYKRRCVRNGEWESPALLFWKEPWNLIIIPDVWDHWLLLFFFYSPIQIHHHQESNNNVSLLFSSMQHTTSTSNWNNNRTSFLFSFSGC